MEKQQAQNKCMQLCSSREYCAFDISEKLNKWEVAKNHSEEIITYLIDNKFINNERYARAYVNDKIKFNHWGKNKLKYYLKHKGIDGEIITNSFNDFSKEEYIDIATTEIQKKLQKTKAKDAFELKSKVAKSIINKGFESDLVFKILNVMLQE
ncbi:MAG: RecX family transcriptional regulator [Salinivirgaceae bacterium]|nr:RecX family transcriptional regulator [Salinivirgaceae bacterium]